MQRMWEVPGSPVVETWQFDSQDLGLIPDQGTKIRQAVWHAKNNNNTV